MAARKKLPIVSPDQRLVLSVGGMCFETAVHTLTTGRAEGSVLEATFRDPAAVAEATGGRSFFIDRNGKVFGHLLEWLRTGSLPDEALSNSATLTQIMAEAKHFELQALLDKVSSEGIDSKAFASSAETKKRMTQAEFMAMYKGAALARDADTWVHAGGLDLSGLDLSGLDLTHWSLQRANLAGANLNGAELPKANLFGANLEDASLRAVNLSYANLRSATLSNADITRSNLFCVDLSHANLRHTTLAGSDLEQASLESADLTSADLSGANLYGSRLSKTKLRSANLENAILGRLSSSGRTIWRGVDLTNAVLAGVDLKNVRFEDPNITQADFTGVKNASNNLFAARDGGDGEIQGLDTARNLPRAVLFNLRRGLH